MSQPLAFKPFILDREEPDSTIDSVASILAYMSAMSENVGNGVLKGGTEHTRAFRLYHPANRRGAVHIVWFGKSYPENPLCPP